MKKSSIQNSRKNLGGTQYNQLTQLGVSNLNLNFSRSLQIQAETIQTATTTTWLMMEQCMPTLQTRHSLLADPTLNYSSSQAILWKRKFLPPGSTKWLFTTIRVTQTKLDPCLFPSLKLALEMPPSLVMPKLTSSHLCTQTSALEIFQRVLKALEC